MVKTIQALWGLILQMICQVMSLLKTLVKRSSPEVLIMGFVCCISHVASQGSRNITGTIQAAWAVSLQMVCQVKTSFENIFGRTPPGVLIGGFVCYIYNMINQRLSNIAETIQATWASKTKTPCQVKSSRKIIFGCLPQRV